MITTLEIRLHDRRLRVTASDGATTAMRDLPLKSSQSYGRFVLAFEDVWNPPFRSFAHWQRLVKRCRTKQGSFPASQSLPERRP